LSDISDDTIVVATSALQTGANLPTVCFVIFYGCAYSPEGWLQGAGRAARLITLRGISIMMCTPFSLSQAIKITNNARGVQQVF
jgi:superfamily II DNA helicase RecQ